MVEGSSLENCRRCEPFVSSNLTASAKHTELEPHALGLFFVCSFESGWRLGMAIEPSTNSGKLIT